MPSGFTTVNGNVNINQSGNTLNVNSLSSKAIVNYQSFNVGSQSVVNFNLPNANSAILNRVVGGNISEVYGQINSNGNVFLVNTAGIVFGGTATVNVGSIIASTLNIEDNNFINGNYIFNRTQTTAPSAIVNNGEINAGSSIVLMAGAINNTNKLASPSGVVRMVSADQATMTTIDGVTFDVEIDKPLNEAVNSYTSSVSNSGSISGHLVELSTKIESTFYERAVNNTGIIEASLLNGQGGEIIIYALANDVSAVIEQAGTIKTLDTVSNTGSINLTGDSIILGGSSSTDGDGSIQFITNSSITQNGSSSLLASSLSVQAGGNVSLNSANNDVDNFSVTTTGDNVTFRDLDSFNLLKADLNLNETWAPGNLNLVSLSGGITQIQETTGIVANEFNLGVNNGTSNLNANNNDVSYLTVNSSSLAPAISPTNPVVNFSDTDGIAILGVNGGTGSVSITAGPLSGATDLNGSLDEGILISGIFNANTVNLTSNSGSINQSSGTFSGNTLTMTGKNGFNNSVTDADFSSISLNGSGTNFTYFDRDGFNVLTSNQPSGSSQIIANYSGITSNNGVSESNISFQGNVQMGSLTTENHLASGTILQPSGYIQANLLNVSTINGDATLLRTTNDIVEFQASSASGTISLYDTNGVLITMGMMGTGDLSVTSSSITLQTSLNGDNITLTTYGLGDINLGASNITSNIATVINAGGDIIGGGTITNYAQIFTPHIELTGNKIGKDTDPIGIGLGLLTGFIRDSSNSSGLNDILGRVTATLIKTLLPSENGLALYPKRP